MGDPAAAVTPGLHCRGGLALHHAWRKSKRGQDAKYNWGQHIANVQARPQKSCFSAQVRRALFEPFCP
jgi:hypothetical protein